tara:strand:+ start:45 stop:602 length:558 start_codon:yes stop_codon:yes gene_type:complete
MIETNQLSGLAGNMQAEPRVFSHDAQAIVVGAINYSEKNKGIKITNFGDGYAPGDFIDFSAGSGSVIASIKVLTISGGAATGPVETFVYRTFGKGYVVGDQLVQTNNVGNQGFNCDVANIDIPNTQQRGCCLYIGASAGIPALSVIMESGNTVSFNTLSAGSILPILVKRITQGGLGTNDVIALY